MVIDALALLPLLLELLFPHIALMLLTRLVRFLKLARYSPALATLGRLIASERRALLACVIIFTGVLLAAAAAMHAVEGASSPTSSATCRRRSGGPPRCWPRSAAARSRRSTTLGRIIAAITVMLGIVCFALPVAIIGRGFYEEIRRRDFVVTFAMVARVPLFARLDAAAIADLVGMLRARTVPAGTTIIHKGERGNAMYLIASGRVEVESASRQGDAGGRRFLRRDGAALPRAARGDRHGRALHRLLVLDADDFLRLVDRLPDIGERVRAVAKRRK